MQLNGTTSVIATTIMAASEPPEPPPRNPDKINASLKQIAGVDSKAMKSLDSSITPNNNNNKALKAIVSLDRPTPPLATATNNVSITTKATISTSSFSTSTNAAPSTASVQLTSSPQQQQQQQNQFQSSTGSSATKISCDSTAVEMDTTNGDTKASLLCHQPASNGSTGGSVNTAESSVASVHQSRATDVLSSSSTPGANAMELRNGCIGASTGNVIPGEDKPIGFGDNAGGDGKQRIMPVACGGSSGESGAQHHHLQQLQHGSVEHESIRLRLENERLAKELNRLKRLFEYSEDGAVGGVELPLSDSNSFDAHSTDGSSSRIDRLEIELKMAKEQISHLKADRRKLRGDKADLLAHVKQLCASLQDKEQELRDFIRNFELRIRETDASNAKVSTERERERWTLLKHARDESERSIALATQLNARDQQLQRIQEQLQEARRQLTGCMSDQESLLSFAPLTPPSGMMSSHATGPTSSSGFGSMSGVAGDRGSCSADSGVRGSSDRESAAGDMNNLSDGTCENGAGPCITVDADSISLVSSHHNMYQYGTPKDRSPTLSPLNSGSFSRSMDVGALSRSVEHLGSPVEPEGPPVTRRLQLKSAATSNTGTLGRTGRGGTWGSISRVFARTRHRNKNIGATAPGDGDGSVDFQWAALTEESYAEKLRQLREASAVPIDRWRASQVLAWLEVALGMPQYSARCAENVKSGKVLLELNDGELETGLGLAHPMHRKKMRLAIEEQRRPELMRYQTIGQLGHTWVASEWLPDIGLPQYAESFMHSLVDARMLDTLSKKELEKFLSVTRKFHQASIVHGIHVLRILKYDRQSLAMRRMQCENVDADPIVWTNQRFIRWARSIDLGEYADNLKDSGVHGGLVVLEPSFSGDTIATALGIPPSKNIIRRHLTTEFDALILPARAQLGQGIRMGGGSVVPITGPGGLQQHPNAHHHHTIDRRSSGSLRFAAWRGSQGSLSKAFGFSTKGRRHDRPYSAAGTASATSPTHSYSSSSENGIYATIGPAPSQYHNAAPPPPPQQPPPASHRVSAPPMDDGQSSLPHYAQHRRVKSISDIEVVAATPV